MPSNLSEFSSQWYAHRIKLRKAIFLLYHSCQLLQFRVRPMLFELAAACAYTRAFRCNEAISRDNNNGRNITTSNGSTTATIMSAFSVHTHTHRSLGNVSTMKIYNRSEIRNHFKSLSLSMAPCPRSFRNLFSLSVSFGVCLFPCNFLFSYLRNRAILLSPGIIMR